MPAWVIEWLPVAPWLGALAILATAAVKLWPFFRRLGHFLDDWLGEPARPGIDARPGAMERLAAIEADLAEVHHEVFPNSGNSLRDRADQTRNVVRHLASQLGYDPDDLEDTLTTKEKQ